MEDLGIMSKEWKPVVDHEGLYEVSDCGEIKNTKTNNLLNGFLDRGGYKKVLLSKNGKKQLFFIHRLVAQAFIPNPENKPCVDHIDTIRTNNDVLNLRWVSHKENSNNELSIKHYSDAKTKWWKDESRHKWMSESKVGEKNPRWGKKEPKEITDKRTKQLEKPIYQYDLNMNLIKKYDCVKSAAEENGFDRSCLSRAARGKYRNNKCYNFIWFYEQQ